jgi:hypothetical protein
LSGKDKDCSRDENIGSPCVIAFLRDRDNLKSKTVPLSFCPKHYYTTEILFSEALENKTGTDTALSSISSLAYLDDRDCCLYIVISSPTAVASSGFLSSRIFPVNLGNLNAKPKPSFREFIPAV